MQRSLRPQCGNGNKEELIKMPKPIKNHTVMITIREDQYQFFSKREDLNLSGWVRRKIDEEFHLDQ